MNSHGWQILDLTGFSGELRYVRGRLKICGVEVHEIPLVQIAVVLIGGAVTVSGAVIAKFSEYDIALLVCDWRKVPIAAASPWSEHTRIGARQQAQASVSVPRKKQAWARIIRSKIAGQAHVLNVLGNLKQSKVVYELSRQVKSGDPDNREAQAARLYWAALPKEHRFIRSPGVGGKYNNSLDYGYTILRGHGIRAITSAGLNGALGVFHRGRSNSFALVDDLMEPFRPMIDYFVFSSLTPKDELSNEDKRQIVAHCNGVFNEYGQLLSTAFEDFAQSFGMYLEGEIDVLGVPSWRGPFNAEEG